MDKVFKMYKGKVKSVSADDFTVDVIVSTANIDRDGDKIPPEAFKKRLKFYKDHPILLSSHQYGDLRKQIGEAANIKITDDGLEVKFKYYVNEGNPEADWAWILAQKGIAGFSVGFIPYAYDEHDFDKDGYRREYTDNELVEISQVLVPSNRDAVQGRRQVVLNLDAVEKDLLDMAIKQFDDGQLRPKVCNCCKMSTVHKPEETDDYIRIPVRDCKITATITISAEKGIKGLYCGEVKKIATYLFAKDKGWTMETAKAWVKEHEEAKDFDAEAIYSAEVKAAAEAEILEVIDKNTDKIMPKIIDAIIADFTTNGKFAGVVKHLTETPLSKDTVLEMVKSALTKKE